MQEVKATGGDWQYACDSYGKVRHSRKACVYTVIKDSSGVEQIVNVAQRIENWDDAKLIHAAPAGLDAAKFALQYLQDYASTDHDDADYRNGVNHAVELIERFIEKATGAKP